MTCDGRVLARAMLQEANWSRSSSCWDMSRFKQPSDTLAASSGFGRRSMIASESNRILELPAPVVEGLATNHPERRDPQIRLNERISLKSVIRQSTLCFAP